MKHNEGLSLIELVVVVAIMAVLVSVVGISVTVVSRQNVSNAASDVRGLLQTAQTVAMSKKNCYVKITQKSNGDWYFETHTYTGTGDDGTKQNEKVLDHLTVSGKVKVEVKSGGSYVSAASTTIEYIRNTGAFKAGAFPSEIRFSRGTKVVTLHLTELTGKVSY